MFNTTNIEKHLNALQEHWESKESFFRAFFSTKGKPGIRSTQLAALLSYLKDRPIEVNIKKTHPDAVIPSYAKNGDAGLDLTAVTVKATDKYVEYNTHLAIEIPYGYVGLLFPRSSISNYNLSLANCVGVIDSGYRGDIKLRFKSTLSTEILKRLNVKSFIDLTQWFDKDEEITPKSFEEDILDQVREDTPHGEYGGEEHTYTYCIHNKFYTVTIHNVQWNRYDKQYYFIDMYDKPQISFKEIGKEELSGTQVENTYNVGDRVGQLIILPYPKVNLKEVQELSDTERSTDGYGSTGK